MVLVYGGCAVDPVRVAEITEAAAEFAARCRAEDGCVDYILSWDVIEPNRLRLVEAWESTDASTAHRAQQHTKEWTAFIGSAAIDRPSFRHVDVPSLDQSTL